MWFRASEVICSVTLILLLLQTASGAKGFSCLAVCDILGKKGLHLDCGPCKNVAKYWLDHPQGEAVVCFKDAWLFGRATLSGNSGVLRCSIAGCCSSWLNWESLKNSRIERANALTPRKLCLKFPIFQLRYFLSHCGFEQKPKWCFMQSLIKLGCKWDPESIGIMWEKNYLYRWKPLKWQNFVAEAIVIYEDEL